MNVYEARKITQENLINEWNEGHIAAFESSIRRAAQQGLSKARYGPISDCKEADSLVEYFRSKGFSAVHYINRYGRKEYTVYVDW